MSFPSPTSRLLHLRARIFPQSSTSITSTETLLGSREGRIVPRNTSLSMSRSSSTASSSPTTDSLLFAIKARRSHHKLIKSSPISDARIQKIVNETVLHCPSSFNSQSTRIMLLLGAQHDRLWEDVVQPAVKAAAPPEVWEQTAAKLKGFQNGYGTVRRWVPCGP